MNNKIYKSAIVLGFALTGSTAFAGACDGLPTRAALETALKNAQSQPNGGFGLHMWATIVNRAGVVCAVAHSGVNSGEQWPGSRVISAQKANTANAFSLPGLALSTANLYTATQPGGSLYGLQESNPVNVDAAYAGQFAKYGTDQDALVGRKIGGINVFGGGLALYDTAHKIIGGLGVSGDSSCADHNIAWRTRFELGLDHVPAGVATAGDDNIVYDIAYGDTSTVSEVPSLGKSAGGWGHPACSPAAKAIAEGFHKADSGSL